MLYPNMRKLQESTFIKRSRVGIDEQFFSLMKCRHQLYQFNGQQYDKVSFLSTSRYVAVLEFVIKSLEME